jgi:hypothetical protein
MWSMKYCYQENHQVKDTLRLAVYRQSVCLGVKPLETHDQRFFSQLNPCGISPYVTSTLTRKWVCLLWICLGFRQVYISHIYRVIEKFLLLHYAQVLCQYRLCKAHHAYLHILCCNGCQVTWTVVSLTTSKFKPLTFSMSGFTLSYTANMFIFMIPCDFCLFPAQFCYTIIYICKVKSCVHIADWCAPWKISSGAQNIGFKALQI